MRVAIAVLVALALSSVGIGMVRSLGARRPRAGDSPPVVPPPDVRITYWCQTCGTEVLVLRKGTETAPRHCGESMTKREETARN